MAYKNGPGPGNAPARGSKRAAVSFPKTKHRVNFAGRILGLRGQNLRAIEARTQTRIFIVGTDPQVQIQGRRAEEAQRMVEAIIDDALWEYTWNNAKFKTDWEKFYVWWYFYNRIGRQAANPAS